MTFQFTRPNWSFQSVSRAQNEISNSNHHHVYSGFSQSPSTVALYLQFTRPNAHFEFMKEN